AGPRATLHPWRPAGPVSISEPPALTVTALSPGIGSPVATGSRVTWTAAASGGTGPYTFKFWVHNGSTWTIAQDWRSAPSWSWTPSVAGTYNFQVWVRNAGSIAPFDAWRPAGPFVVACPPPVGVTRFFSNHVM